MSENDALDKEYITMGPGDFWGEGSLMEGVQGVGQLHELTVMQYHIDSLTFVELMVCVCVCARARVRACVRACVLACLPFTPALLAAPN